MYLRFIGGIALAAMLAVYIAPAPTSAAVLTDAQIQAITSLAASFGVDASVVNRIESVLKGNTVSGGESNTSVGVTEPARPAMPQEWRHRICKRLLEAQDFPTLGTQSTFAQDLQDFLAGEGLFNIVPTGYFGNLTREAIGKWQEEHGITTARDSAQGWGILGPRTRAAIAQWCNGGMRFNAEPTKGAAPLTVTFSTWIGGLRADRDTVKFYIDFGDNSSPELATECSAPADRCESPGKNTHTYTADGTYKATLIKETDFCRGNTSCMAPIGREVIGKQQIHVGTTVCTEEYAPVCGAKPIVCITTPCNPVPTTYSNRCKMSADSAKFLYEGQCRTDTVQPFVPDRNCKAWYDGCNNCSRQTADSPAACTLRACVQQLPGYCTARFDDSTTTNQPPTISSFSGPTTLALNTSGTWSVSASDPENGTLSYQVLWGDENIISSAIAGIRGAEADFVQDTSFTHAYARSGTYTVIIVVRDDRGGMSKATATVKVGDGTTSCTLEYSPVCGQPPEPSCRHSLPACMLATPGPQTYQNACVMKLANATLIYTGACTTNTTACTQEAKLCPDGSYVGRTGPNCEFKCPTSTTNTCVYNGQLYASGQYTELACNDGRLCWNSGKVYVCRGGDFKWESCGWGNLTGPRDPLTCEGGPAAKKTDTTSTTNTTTAGTSCTGALGTYADGMHLDGQTVTGGPYTMTVVGTSYQCKRGIWTTSCAISPYVCNRDGAERSYVYDASVLGKLREVTQ